jgi:hypothetical protein
MYPRLLIQYIRSYAPYLEAVPPSATPGRAMLWGQGFHLTWFKPKYMKQIVRMIMSRWIRWVWRVAREMFKERVLMDRQKNKTPLNKTYVGGYY